MPSAVPGSTPLFRASQKKAVDKSMVHFPHDELLAFGHRLTRPGDRHESATFESFT
jgi:hypothetical protein